MKQRNRSVHAFVPASVLASASLAALLAFAAPGAFAQKVPSATSSRYVTPYVQKHSQFDSMAPRPASQPTLYGADTALKPQADGHRLQSPVNTGTQSRSKRARLSQAGRPAPVAAGDDIYSNDLWNAGQTYASPETSSPYSAR